VVGFELRSGVPGALDEVDGHDAGRGEGVSPDLTAELWGEAREEVEYLGLLERTYFFELSCQVLDLVLQL
jgi:hypothetical protein